MILHSIILQNLTVLQDPYSLLSISVNDLADPVFNGVGLTGFSMVWDCSLPFCLPLFSSFFLSLGWYCMAVVFRLIGCR